MIWLELRICTDNQCYVIFNYNKFSSFSILTNMPVKSALLILTVLLSVFLISINCRNNKTAIKEKNLNPSPSEVVQKDSMIDNKTEYQEADQPVQGSDTARHRKKIAEIKKKNYRLVLVGNSIIHTLGEFGGKYKPLQKVWMKHFAHRNAINLGYSGYRTENILWNLQNGELDFKTSPKVVVLLIGTNNADNRRFKVAHNAEHIYAGTKAIVTLIHKKHPNTKILIIRIFPRGGDREKGIGKGVFHSSDSCINTCIKAGALTKSLADDKNIYWIDVGKVFLLPDSTINTKLMPDLLHPNAAGAEAWMKAIEPTLSRLLGDKRILYDKKQLEK